MFNFQGSVACKLSLASFSILSHRFGFVKNFFQTFQNFFWIARFSVLFLQPISLRQLCNSITSSSLCQVLFLIFLNLFYSTPLRTLLKTALNSLFRAAASLLPCLAFRDSFTILPHHAHFVKHYFFRFLIFFIFFHFLPFRLFSSGGTYADCTTKFNRYHLFLIYHG